MSSIYYAMFILPAIFMVSMSFVFQSGVQDIRGNMFIANCPFPIWKDGVSNLNIQTGSNTVTYDVIPIATGSQSYANVTQFFCSYTTSPLLLSANTKVYIFGSDTLGTTFGFFSYVSDSMTTIGQKIQYTILAVWGFINAPASISALSFYTYINVMLFLLIGAGVFLAIRGSG